MHRYDPVRGEYSTRDLTSRAMWMEILAGRGGPNGGVYLSVAHLPDNVIDNWVAKNNPGYNFGGVKLEEEGVDIKCDGLEVAPMAHFYLGGILINERCESDIPGMYAAGEVAAVPGVVEPAQQECEAAAAVGVAMPIGIYIDLQCVVHKIVERKTSRDVQRLRY